MKSEIYKWIKDIDMEKVVVSCVLSICIVLSMSIFSLFFGIYDYISVFLFSFIFLCVAFLAYFLIKNRASLTKYDKIALLICLFFSLLVGLFYHATLWGAYDSGVYSFSAIHYANNGSFFIEERDWPFSLYYQGFLEKEYRMYSQFSLPGYSVFLSLFYEVGSIESMFWGNAFLLFFSTLILYLLGKKLGNARVGLIFIILFSLHYTTLWFARETLAESLMILLIWTSFFLFISGIKKRNGNYLLMSFIPLTLSLIVRFEALLHFIIFPIVTCFCIIYLKKYKRGYSFQFSKKSILFFSSAIGLNIFNLIYYYLLVSNYYINYYLAGIWQIASRIVPTLAQHQIPIEYPTYQDYILRFVFDSFNAYLIIPLLIFIIFGLKNKRYNKHFILLTLLASPSFLLIIYPTTSWTHPWFLRHYWVVLIPLLFLAIAIGIEAIENKNIKIFSVFSVIVLFMSISSPIFFLAEERNTPNQLEEIHNIIKDTNSIVIADQTNRKIAEPLHFIYGYRALPSTNYEFDVTTASEELKLSDMYNIYVISPYLDTTNSKYDILPGFRFYSDDELELIGKTSYPIENLRREREADKYARPGEVWPPKRLEEGYAPIQRALKNIPPIYVSKWERTLFLYRVIDSP